MLGHSVRGVFGPGDVSIVDLAGGNQVTKIVRSNVERFAALLGVLQVVVNSDGRLVVAEKREEGQGRRWTRSC